MNPFYQINQEAREAHIYIYGPIVTNAVLPSDVSATSLVNQLKDLDVDVIHVHIDSCGGAVSEGWTIYNALIAHPAKIITHGDGFVASAALYPFLAGDERQASTVSGYYFHQVMSGAWGYSDDLRKAAEEADALTSIGINAFVERAGMDAQFVRELMEKETWVTPDQALEYGLATSVVTAPQSAGSEQSAKKEIFARLANAKPASNDPTPEPVTMMQTLMQSLEK